VKYAFSEPEAEVAGIVSLGDGKVFEGLLVLACFDVKIDKIEGYAFIAREFARQFLEECLSFQGITKFKIAL